MRPLAEEARKALVLGQGGALLIVHQFTKQQDAQLGPYLNSFWFLAFFELPGRKHVSRGPKRLPEP